MDLIKGLENKTLEFKSTLQWDVHQKKKNKDLWHPVLRTIGGFMNSDGGTLLIGVDDDGNVLGLENDLKLTKQSLDHFSQLLSNIISDYLGAGYSRFMDFRYEEIEGKMICVVEVESASKAAFLNWQDNKEFHIRVGNTTKQLDTQEAMDYISMNWD